MPQELCALAVLGGVEVGGEGTHALRVRGRHDVPG